MRMTLFPILLVLFLCGCKSTPPRVTDSETLSPGDRVLIVLTRTETMEIREVLNPRGEVSLFLVGNLRLSGLTLQQAQEVIKRSYVPMCWPPPLKVTVSKIEGD